MCTGSLPALPGKTTLLDILSGRRTGPGRSGEIRINGHKVTPAQVRARAPYATCAYPCSPAVVKNTTIVSYDGSGPGATAAVPGTGRAAELAVLQDNTMPLTLAFGRHPTAAPVLPLLPPPISLPCPDEASP